MQTHLDTVVLLGFLWSVILDYIIYVLNKLYYNLF